MASMPMLRAAVRQAAAPLRPGRATAVHSAARLAPSCALQLQQRWVQSGRKLDAPAAAHTPLTHVEHFRLSRIPHPLRAKPHQQIDPSKLDMDETPIVNLMQNHIWSKQEIQERLQGLYQHRPESLSDRCMHGIMYALYRSFNWVTGFKPQNTPVKAVEWRLIVLESFAGVPGFMAAMFRHFRSLRLLKRDHGWIHTLLEEAENERMHLLVCMKMFKAGYVTRLLVLAAQVFMTPWLGLLYAVHPRSVHRFVGYLEETACLTYANIIHQVQTPGTPLNEAWADLPAPALAKVYWKLPEDAMWVDALQCMFADEANHRDVNHTFATMRTDDPNPFVEKHLNNAVHAWRLEARNRKTDIGDIETLGTKQLEQMPDTLNVDGAR